MKEPLEQVTETVTGAGHRLGEYIRDQRRGSQISLRQLATLAGVSNPYLSQIERGLRKPSAEILQQIAKGLRISAEALYVQAGILERREGDPAVAEAVLGDEGLSERQKQVLLEIYESFRKENAAVAGPATPPVAPRQSGDEEPGPAPRRRTPKRTTQPGTAAAGTAAPTTKGRRAAKAATPRTGKNPTTAADATVPTPQEARS